MEMEDQSSHHNTQFGIDLRQFMTGRPTPPHSSNFPPLIPSPPPPPELFPSPRNLHNHHHHHYDLMMFMPPSGSHLHNFPTTTTNITPPMSCVNTSTTICASSSSCLPSTNSTRDTLVNGGLEGDGGCFNIGTSGGDIGGTVRWPRQETLTLLEVRSRLDSKFKEANQKGPLWDEVSRIMSEEHGYQRSGKKCREKFENLYKYYKKTKEGKAGRQDGKHYRFFRQLEALYGETSNPTSTQETHLLENPHSINTSYQANNNQLVDDHNFHPHKLICDSLSLSNSSEFNTTSSEENDLSAATMENDSSEKRRKRKNGKRWKVKVKEFLDTQLRKLVDRQEVWLEKLTRTLEEKEQERLVREEEWRKREAERVEKEHVFWAKEREWIEARDAALMEALEKLSGREVINVSSPENASGGLILNINKDEREAKDCYNKKRKENTRSSSYFQGNESLYYPGGGGGYGDALPSNSNVGNAVSDSCFRFLMSGGEGGEHLWENYSELNLKLNKVDHGNE